MAESFMSLPLPLALPLPNGWDAGLLEPVAEINERMLECLHRGALALRAGDKRNEPALLWALAEDWCALGSALPQLAACPYLLLDAGLRSTDAVLGGERGCATVRDATALTGYFPGPEGVALVRRTLMFAWHVARCNRVVARIVLGVGGSALERIAASRLQDLDALAEHAHAWAAPRWQSQPAVWRQLLRTARCEGPSQLRLLQLRGLQLMAAQQP